MIELVMFFYFSFSFLLMMDAGRGHTASAENQIPLFVPFAANIFETQKAQKMHSKR